MRKLFSLLKNEKGNRDSWFLVFIVSLFVLRIPSLIEPYWYGDEGIYEVIGIALRQGRLLYQGIWDNKPPLLYIIYAIFNGDQFSVRFVSLVFGILASCIFFILSRKIFKTRRSSYISTIVFTLFFATPIYEGNIANSENFMVLPTLLSLFFIFKFIDDRKKIKYLIYAGIFLSLSFLIKAVAIFDFIAFLLCLFATSDANNFSRRRLKLITTYPKAFLSSLKPEIYFVLSMFFLPMITVLYFLGRGAINDYFRAAFSQNVGYVGYGNFLLFPMGLLFLKTAILIIIIFVVLRNSHKIGTTAVFVYLWVTFSLYSTLFSARPYTHYVLVFIPALSVLVGFLYDNKKFIKINMVILLISTLIIFRNFHYYSKTFSYYGNYLDFVFKSKSVDSYLDFFDPNTKRDYDIVKFIETHTNKNDEIFLWSDSAQIYALSNKLPPGRYAVSYHVTFYKNAIDETKKALSIKKPKYIIVTKKNSDLANFVSGYNLKYRMGDTDIYERSY